jgi:hypothetical protein
MPTINGISASIATHDGQLEEFAVGEFPGGASCFIIAHSGQQFWLNYEIHHPIRAKALSVEFHVDGHRIDTQFPLAAEGDDRAMVGPVKSSITSQYKKDAAGNVYRRDIFFTLVDKVNNRNTRASATATGDSTLTEKAGMIECKIYRAEKIGEWDGVISPEAFPAGGEGEDAQPKGVSHRARLGADIPAVRTTRYTFQNLDAEDSPFAFFRFYYRSKKFIQRMRQIHRPLSRPSSPLQIPRSLSRNLSRQSSLYQSLSKGKGYLSGKLTSFQSEITDITPTTMLRSVLSKSSPADSTVQAAINILGAEYSADESTKEEEAEKTKDLLDKLGGLVGSKSEPKKDVEVEGLVTTNDSNPDDKQKAGVKAHLNTEHTTAGQGSNA